MKCPKCRSLELGRLRIASSVGAWTCLGCEGIWVPAGRALGARPPAELSTGEGSEGAELDSRAGLCPEGHGILTRAQTHVDGGFFLERCATCSGVWFDKGEWHRIAAAGLDGGLFEIWSAAWQREQLRARSAAAYREELESELGRDLMGRIDDLAAALRVHPSRSLALAYLLRRVTGEEEAPE